MDGCEDNNGDDDVVVDISSCSDEEKRKLLKPAPTEEQVLQLLMDHYYLNYRGGRGDSGGEEGREENSSNIAACRVLQQLDSYDDVNYKVEIDGTTYLLKIHNGVESDDFLEQTAAEAGTGDAGGGGGVCFYKKGRMSSVIHLQNAMQELLSEHGIVTNMPVRPLVKGRGATTTSSSSTDDRGSPALVASLPVTSAAHSPRQLVVRLLTWVPGTPLSCVQVYSLEVLADAGRFLGLIDKTLDNLSSSSLAGALDKVGSSAALLSRSSFVGKPPAALGVGGGLSPLPLTQLHRGDSAMDRVRASLGMTKKKPPNSGSGISSNDNKGGGAVAVLDESLMIPACRYHQWDGKNTADLRGFVQHIDNTRRRDLVVSVIDAFQRDVLDSGAAERFRKGVNHADFNDANILMDSNLKVSGIIDFGDSVESWRVLEISTGMAYAMVSNYGKSNQSLSAAAGLLRGYNSVYGLSNLEKEHLRLLIACRLACSVTLGAYSYKQNPDNHYLLLHAEPAWRALELIWPYDHERREQMGKALNFLFEQACLHSSSHAKVVSCYDLVIPDPDVADLLESVRIKFGQPVEPSPRKKQKVSHDKNEDRKNASTTTITFVSGSAKKFEEVKLILESSKPSANGEASDTNKRYQLTSQRLDDLPEQQGNPIDIAREKCLSAVEKIGSAVIAEVTSLCFNALNGLPGPYIRWFLDCGLESLNKMIAAFDDKTGYAQTVVAFCPGPGQEVMVFDGKTTGEIVPPRGSASAYGWDPIFQPQGYGKTFAEMTAEEKDALSHRGRAFQQLRDYLNKSWDSDGRE